MVIRKVLRRFRRDEDGVVLVEALLSLPIIILMTVAMVECAMLLFQWNLTVKALQIGARTAAVSDPAVGGTVYDTLADDYVITTGNGNNQSTTPIPEGDPVPAAIRTVSCGYGTTACDAAALAKIYSGGDSCGVVTAGGPTGICDVAAFIRPENLLISYHRAGLGYVGRPFGVVTTITVEIRNQNFDFLFLDTLLPGILGQIPIPAHPVSITSEDLTDCNPSCP